MHAPEQVPVTRRHFRCGCVTGHTRGAYLAEAEFCEEGLALHEELLYLRRRQRKMDLEHPCLPAAVAALEKKERAIDVHRGAAGLLEEKLRVVGNEGVDASLGAEEGRSPSPRTRFSPA